MHVASPPGDLRLFVVEQHTGRIRIVDASGTILAEPFLDVGDEIAKGGEEGLLSVAFSPDYATSGRFYVYLTGTSPTGQLQVREYRRSAADPNRADPASMRLVLSQDHPGNSNHNGGSMLFGPDGMLWVGMGDGGSANDPPGNAQNKGTLLGKLLRIDPRGPALAPAGNPFLAPTDGARDEIWHYGLRNPWRFSFDRQTGDLVIADVGQNEREEVDFAPASAGRLPGANWGWRCREGTLPGAPCTTPATDARDPVHELSHATDGACSITGGFVVRDPGLPTLAGRYLYGDFCLPNLRSVVLSASAASGDRAESALPVQQVSSFAEDACGRILLTSLAGPVQRVVEGAPSPCTPSGGAGGILPPGGSDPTAPAGCGVSTRFPRRRSLRSVLRRGLGVGVRLRSPCTLAGRATVRRVGTLRARSRQAVPGRRIVLRHRASRGTRRALRAALRRRPQVTAKVSVITSPPGGGSRSLRTRRVRIVR